MDNSTPAVRIKNMRERYNEYISDPNKVWYNRFIWQGLYGKAHIESLSIYRFARETGSFNNLPIFSSVAKLHKHIHDTLCTEYVKWCKEKDLTIFTNTYNGREDDVEKDLRNFFLGAMGEYFFVFFLEEIGEIVVNGHPYSFKYVHPLLSKESDSGVDLCGVIVKHSKYEDSCVIQVKFWNPFIDVKITDNIISRAATTGIYNDYIIKDGECENIVVCWLGKDGAMGATKFLRNNNNLFSHCLILGQDTLNKKINNKRNNTFWIDFNERMKEIGRTK